MEIAVASVGVALAVDNGTITRARVAYGSVAPVPLPGSNAEATLVGQPLNEGVIAKAFYVGAQITCWTFIIHYGMEQVGLMAFSVPGDNGLGLGVGQALNALHGFEVKLHPVPGSVGIDEAVRVASIAVHMPVALG